MAKGNSSVCIYIGNGLKHSDKKFSIAAPVIQNEYTAEADYKFEVRDDGESNQVLRRPPLEFQPDLSTDPNWKPPPVAEPIPETSE